jgi:sugar porter (SP) family MFS transporter
MDSKINKFYVALLSVIVALGGFLLGFDSAVIAGAVPYYSKVFGLDQTSFWFGFSVSALTVGSIAGNFIGGILADKYGRKIILISTATLFAFCALGSALTSNFVFFIISRLIGGLGVGMAILVAPMYIAEVAPQKYRGTLVSVNQLNIVLGITIAFFSNYFINNSITDPNLNWRWMLGVGIIPAILYFLLLFFVPASPRWLAQQGRTEEAKKVLTRIGGDEYAGTTMKEIETSIEKDKNREKAYFKELFTREMRWILIIGLGIAFLQQISAINAILYYAPIIFETAGGGRDVAFMQAVILGVVNLVFTIVAMFLIDKLGRKPLLVIGLSGIIVAYILSAFAFFQADYKITQKSLDKISVELTNAKFTPENTITITQALASMKDVEYSSEVKFFKAVNEKTGSFYNDTKNIILKNSITMNAVLVLIGILLFMASFAISLGPVTWALLSEIFPNRIRGLAISVAGTFNALVSASVVTVFPMELAKFGSGLTFAIFAVICFGGLLFVLKYIPETKGKSLEQLEEQLTMRH